MEQITTNVVSVNGLLTVEHVHSTLTMTLPAAPWIVVGTRVTKSIWQALRVNATPHYRALINLLLQTTDTLPDGVLLLIAPSDITWEPEPRLGDERRHALIRNFITDLTQYPDWE